MATTKTPASKKSTAKKSTKKAPAKKKAPTKAAKKTTTKKAKPAARKKKAAADEEVTIDRRAAANRREEEGTAEAKPALERRQKVNRRRQIDPTTCERDYSDAEVEFMNALDAYKRSSGRMFPTCSEVLEVIRGMGYVQLSPAEQAMIRNERGEIDEPADLEDSATAEAEAALDESDELRID